MLKSTFPGNKKMKPRRKNPAGSAIPNWLLYSGIGVLLSAGAIKIAWGLFRLYR